MNKTLQIATAGLVFAACFGSFATAGNRAALRNICTVKGQEENTLTGLGLVVGLNGTGESGDAMTMRNLARAMELLGSPVSMSGRLDEDSLEQLKNIKNVALVMVTATVPGTGAMRGQKLDCHVMALNGKSLDGGRLVSAALKGPNTQDPRVFALCQGQLQIDDPEQPMVGVIHGGCQMAQNVMTPFELNGYVTLILDPQHADFLTVEEIVGTIRDTLAPQFVRDDDPNAQQKLESLAIALNASVIRVKIPDILLHDPVAFVAQLLEIEVYGAEPEARVVVNPRTGNVAISGDVEIGAVVISHRNLVIEAGAQTGEFVAIDPGQKSQTKLKRLLDALSALKVPPDDIVDILRGIEASGKLHAKLIIK